MSAVPVLPGSRVVVVCSDPGIPAFGTKGASVHLQAVLAELVRRGDDVHLLTPRPGGAAPEALAGVRVHRLPGVSGARGGERELAARRSDAGAAVLLDRLHGERTVDLVLERYSLWGRTATAWAARHGVPSVLEVNAPLVREQSAHRVLHDRVGAEQVAREALEAAGVVVCVSEGVAGWARDVVADPGRIHVVPNGVDTDRVTPVARRGGARPLTVGFVGTLKPWHGTEHLVDAVALLLGREPGWRLLVVGDGPQREALQARCARWGIEDAVELVGAVRPEAVLAHLHRMDVGCAPYEDLDDFYFSPLKVYEYLAAGLPVVASRVPGMSGLLRGGELGRLVRPGDAEDLAAALAALAADPDARASTGERARRTAVREHTWTAVVERVLALSRTGEVTGGRAADRAAGPLRTGVA